ncbi:hypothetical protein JZ751_028662, partial [Albula glossodonta]
MSQSSPCRQCPSPPSAPPSKDCRVKMAAHKRHFKCFDALLDDLSQRAPLPAGVRTATSPRGSHALHHSHDGSCCSCADPQQGQLVSPEWGHGHRKPTRPDEEPPSSGHSGHHHHHHHPHRHRKRVVLVRNNDPAVRRTIVLNPKAVRSLRLFMDEISELMHTHIRKLYTLDGRKIDSIQSLIQCPSVVVCVGREPFHPLLVESFRKKPEEKLPRLSPRSRSIISAEGQECRRNVNFGLETKRGVIHPRSDSSTRSTRYSLSSEKSFPGGFNSMTQGNSACPHVSMRDEDIEKKVHVNKDGSLSVQMKVRFHLMNDETLQWSTEIKKSPGTTNDQAHYLPQSHSESCSDTESLSAYEAEDAYITKLHEKHLDEPHCQHCCVHCQEYEIWKSQIEADMGAVRHSRSSSSSVSSHTIVRKKSSVDSTRTMSQTSEEYTEHVVEKAACFQQTAENGDTTIEYCTISRSCSRSEVVSVTSKSRTSTVEKHESVENAQTSDNDDTRPATGGSVPSKGSHTDQVSVKVTQVSEEDDRSTSAISSSSQVLETLKEDQDDDEDLPPSQSRASSCSRNGDAENDGRVKSAASNACSATVCRSSASSVCHLTPRPPSKASTSSARSARSVKSHQVASSPPEVPEDKAMGPGDSDVNVEDSGKELEARASSSVSAKSNVSSSSKKSNISSCKSCG